MSQSPAAPSSTGTPDVGAVLGGKYRVIRRIGEGGMGVVVEAENSVTGKRVAIKWMHPHVAARPEATERFLREARASARVRHPNVVDVYDVVHEADTCFLVMELLDGEPLTAVLERGGMPAHELIALLLEAMRGVAAAHRQGVIHRDIKPDNIFLCEEPDRKLRTPKVVDFGISKVTGGDAMSLTRTGAALGTPMYMSFEQICGVKDIDARTDVYAFGVVLYEALTGKPPFHAESFPELIVKISNTRPTPPKILRPDIPRSLDDLVQRAMAKDREERVLSLDVLIRALEPFASAQSFRAQMTADDNPLPRVVARADEAPEPTEPAPLVVQRRESALLATPMEANVPIPSPPRRRDALTWLIAGGALVTALGALTWYGTSQDPAARDLARLPSGEPARPKPAAPAPTPAASPTASGDPAPAAASQPAPAPGPDHVPEPVKPPSTRHVEGGDITPAIARPSAAPTAAPQSRPAPTKPQPSSTASAPSPRPALGTVEKPALPAMQKSGLTPVPPAAAATKPQADRPAPATAKPAPATDPRFRAGRPRTEDF